jgi:hypothetical protein
MTLGKIVTHKQDEHNVILGLPHIGNPTTKARSCDPGELPRMHGTTLGTAKKKNLWPSTTGSK